MAHTLYIAMLLTLVAALTAVGLYASRDARARAKNHGTAPRVGVPTAFSHISPAVSPAAAPLGLPHPLGGVARRGIPFPPMGDETGPIPQSFCLFPRHGMYMAPGLTASRQTTPRANHTLLVYNTFTPSERFCRALATRDYSAPHEVDLVPRVLPADPLGCTQRYADFTGFYCALPHGWAIPRCVRWPEVVALPGGGGSCGSPDGAHTCCADIDAAWEITVHPHNDAPGVRVYAIHPHSDAEAHTHYALVNASSGAHLPGEDYHLSHSAMEGAALLATHCLVDFLPVAEWAGLLGACTGRNRSLYIADTGALRIGCEDTVEDTLVTFTDGGVFSAEYPWGEPGAPAHAPAGDAFYLSRASGPSSTLYIVPRRLHASGLYTGTIMYDSATAGWPPPPEHSRVVTGTALCPPLSHTM